MAKKTYIGVAGVARQVKKMYVGVNGVARKVKKAYIGVAGVARQFFGGGELSYYGTASDLSSYDRCSLAATTIGDYAIFGGGNYLSSNKKNSTNITDAYNNSLTKANNVTALIVSVSELAATSIGDYALLCGGNNYVSGGASACEFGNAYTPSLTRSTPTLLSQKRGKLAAATVGNYALFGGGTDGSTYYMRVDAYDTSLTRTSPYALVYGVSALAATTIGNYALFGGGSRNATPDHSSVVTAYNTSLTTTQPTDLSSARSALSATSVGGYALFGGGWSGPIYTPTYYSTVDAYNSSLTRTTPTSLSVTKRHVMSASIEDYALFCGGYGLIYESSSQSYRPSYEKSVDAYDSSLTRTIQTELSKGRSDGAGTSVGNYALFGGGQVQSSTYSSEYTRKVDVYQVI